MTQKERKRIIKTISYFCPHCGNINQVINAKMTLEASVDLETFSIANNAIHVMDQMFEMRCPSCFATMHPVDDRIAQAVATFNVNGFPTIYSCSGHYNYRVGAPHEITSLQGYILFGYQPYNITLKPGKVDEAINEITKHVNTMKKSIKMQLDYYKSQLSTREFIPYCDYVIVKDSNSVNDDPRFTLEVDVKRIDAEKLSPAKRVEIINGFRKTAMELAMACHVCEFDMRPYLADLLSEDGIPWITVHHKLEE